MIQKLYHISQILEIYKIPVPEKEILFALGKYIKNRYREIKKENPEKAEFFEKGEKFRAYCYTEKDFELIITLTEKFKQEIKNTHYGSENLIS